MSFHLSLYYSIWNYRVTNIRHTIYVQRNGSFFSGFYTAEVNAYPLWITGAKVTLSHVIKPCIFITYENMVDVYMAIAIYGDYTVTTSAECQIDSDDILLRYARN